MNLVFGYTNSDPTFDVVIAVDTVNQNAIIPLAYNDVQPFLFLPGSNTFVFTVKDTNHVLTTGSNGVISWFLSGHSVNITHDDVQNVQDRCDVKYLGACPPGIDNFCEDSLYCNGQEMCYTAIFSVNEVEEGNPLTGTCVQSSEVINCSSGTQCDEPNLACINSPTSLSPSMTPSDSPTTTAPSEEEVTTSPSLAPSSAPSEEETTSPTTLTPSTAPSEEVVTECTVNGDCTSHNTFCGGPFECNAGVCEAASLNYNPCTEQVVQLNLFYSQVNHSVDSGYIIECVEHIQQCVEVFVCDSDSDCNDGNICNGEETCTNSRCSSQSNVSVATICGSSQMICTENGGCSHINDDPPTAPPPNSTAGIIVIIVLTVCIGVMLILAIAYTIWINYRSSKFYKQKKQHQKKPKTKRR
jgi:hypothetical protein